MTRATCFSILLLLLSCAALRHTMPGPEKSSGRGLEAFGDIELSIEGERYRAKIDVCDGADGNFRCACFDIFGSTVVSIVADSGTAEIAFGEESYRIGREESLAAIPYFRRYPFTFEQLRRILLGRIPSEFLPGRDADTSWTERRIIIQKWRDDSVRVTIIRHSRTGALKQVVVEGDGWRLVRSGDEELAGREIRFETEGRNYFTIRFQRVQVDDITCDR